MGNMLDYLFDLEEDSDKGFCCVFCGEYCSEDCWNDGDVCDSCLGIDKPLFQSDRGFFRSNNCKGHKNTNT